MAPGELLMDGDGEKPEYTGMKKSYAPVIITNLQTAKAVNGQIKVEIENRYNFLNLSALRINAKIGDRIFPVHADIAPLNKGFMNIDIPRDISSGILKLTFADPRGFICQEEVIEFGYTAPAKETNTKLGIILTEDINTCVVKSGEVIFYISKIDGTLECSTSGGNRIINSGGAMMLVPFNKDDGGAPHIAGNNFYAGHSTIGIQTGERL